MTKTSSAALLIVFALTACEAPPPAERIPQLKLPTSLTEVSGLTLAPDGDVLAVADERAEIYRIRFDAAEVMLHSRFGKRGVKGDFEGSAVLDDTLYIVTSDGDLLQQPLDDEDGSYEKSKTGLKKICELEGLTSLPQSRRLLLLCKTPYEKGSRKHLLIYAWSVDDERLDEEPWLSRPYAELESPRLHPSGLAFNAAGNLLIVAAREQRYLVLSASGEVVRQGKLPNAHVHLQTEGVVVTSSNTLYLADEGQAGRGTITRYERFF